MSLNNPISIAPRYTRSINILRDFSNDHVGVLGYQATPLVIQMVERVINGLQTEATERAFSIIGSYGAGKSAFVVFLAHYLQSSPKQRRVLLEQHATDGIPLNPPYEGPQLLTLKISGNNESLRLSLLQSLLELFDNASFLKNEQFALQQTVAKAIAEDASPQHIANILSELSSLVKERSEFQGIALFIDELGQFLDYASRQGDDRELFVLQTIAEMAARSGDTPCIIITILHQAFERYLGTSGLARRMEWAKVQGRFVELPFQEPPTQVLRIVAKALCPDPEQDPYSTVRADWAKKIVPITEKLGLRPAELSQSDWEDIVARSYPIHPSVLIALPPLFRQLAQNERSLFSFLTAPEPFSLSDVIQNSTEQENELPIYRLTHLYEYVYTNLAASLFGRARSQRWLELAEARTLLGDQSLRAFNILTVIGTLGALGRAYGLRASREQITFALEDSSEHIGVDTELDELYKRKLITYRQHSDSYILWEGSDLDIDGIFQTLRQVLGNSLSLVKLLQQHAETSPILAYRHSYVTGSTRAFAVHYVDTEYILSDLPITEDSDGELLYVVPSDDEELAAAYKWATADTRDVEYHRVIVLPNRIRELRELILDVAALRKILNERPELESDRAARREVSSRLAEAQQLLSHTLSEVYAPSHSRWFRRGHEINIQTAHQVDELLSTACDETYYATPHIWNELIVRKQLSSATAKARRNLVEALHNHVTKETLDIEGYPPERAIYESILRKGGLHRLDDDGNWYIGRPTADDPLNLLPTWEAMEQFVRESYADPRPLKDLYSLLEKPPFGIKAGLAPLLFAILYITHAGEITIYERESFAPIVDIALLERLLARPEVFSIRLSRASGARLAVYERLAQALAPQALQQPVQPALLTTSLPLLRLYRSLPEYSKTTKRISEVSQSIRTALKDAKAPDELLFEKLPHACGFDPFKADEPINEMQIEMFFSALRTGLEDLQQAYPQLLDHIQNSIHKAFEASLNQTQALRDELLERYRAINNSGEAIIRSFGVRLETADSGDAWLESVAALVAKRPPENWSDDDVSKFENAISDLGRRFRVAEQVAITSQTISPEAPVLRVGVATPRGENSRVVRLSNQNSLMDELRDEIRTVLARYDRLTKEQQTAVLAELLDPLLREQDPVSLHQKDINS